MSDDEVTRTADAELVAAVRAEAMRHGDDPPLEVDVEPHFAEPDPAEPSDDVTVAHADVLASIRAAVADARADASTERPSTSRQDDVPGGDSAVAAVVAAAQPPSHAPPSAPRPAGRWSPPPRLKPAETPRPAPILTDVSEHPSRRRTVVAILALVVAVAVGAYLIGRGGDNKAPTNDTVPATTVAGASTTASATP